MVLFHTALLVLALAVVIWGVSLPQLYGRQHELPRVALLSFADHLATLTPEQRTCYFAYLPPAYAGRLSRMLEKKDWDPAVLRRCMKLFDRWARTEMKGVVTPYEVEKYIYIPTCASEQWGEEG